MVAVAVAGLLGAVLAAGSSGRATASAAAAGVKPQNGGAYPVGVTMAGVCQKVIKPDGSIDWVVQSVFQRWFQGAWSNANYLPHQGTANCTDRLEDPGRWRLLVMFFPGTRTQVVSHFTVGGSAWRQPCTGKDTQVVSVSTPNGGTSGLEDLRGNHLRANQTLTANSDVSLDFGDGSRVNISKGSSFKLDGCSQFKAPNLESEFRFTLLLGRIWSKVTHVFGAERERVSTCTERAACVAFGARGTTFWVENENKGTVLLHVDKGTVTITPRWNAKWKVVTVTAGRTATLRGKKRPAVKKAPIELRPHF